MRILIACECSQVVCKAFREKGHEAYSNDIVPCYGNRPEWHIIGDATNVVLGRNTFRTEIGGFVKINTHWDMIIAHPPCTMLTNASTVAFSKGIHTEEDVLKAANFFLRMLAAPAKYICVENPVPMKRAKLPPYDQIINPYCFGHEYSKRTCLWLKNLPCLIHSTEKPGKVVSWHDRFNGGNKMRSRTFEGIAYAMAEQWG